MNTARRFATVILVAFLAFSATRASSQDQPQHDKPDASLAPIEDIEGLPRVLLIGDSISMGYTLPVRRRLAGIVNLHRIPTNGGPTTKGLAEIDNWLGDKPWDVIHFNWGLHDLRQVNGRPQVALEEYKRNLAALVARLEKTGAVLIWCSTTPVPEGAGGRITGDEVRYNEAALTIMQAHKIAVNDLYAFARPKLAEIQQPRNVHFSPAGSKVLGEEVARRIFEALPKK